MELTTIKERIFETFNINSVDQVFTPALETVLNHKTDVYNKYVKAVEGDLSQDYLQKVYQYYCADRENLGQDYTPLGLGKLLGAITKDTKKIVDVCSGSGALTIQAWNVNPNRTFTCYEVDERAVAILLFNLCVRNIEGYVHHQDLFDDKRKKVYKLTKDTDYSIVEVKHDSRN